MFSFKKKANKRKQQEPFDRVKCGNLEAAIWKNLTRDGASYYRFSLHRLVGNGRGGKGGRSFSPEHALDLAGLSQELAWWFAQDDSLNQNRRRELKAYGDLLAQLRTGQATRQNGVSRDQK